MDWRWNLWNKEILLTIEQGNELNLDLNEDIEKIASLLEIDRSEIIFYLDRTRQSLINHYNYNNVNLDKMGEICEIFQEYSFADKRRLKEIVKINLHNL